LGAASAPASFGFLVLAISALAAPGAPAQSARLLLQEAYYLEVGKCDPASAAEVYRRVLDLKTRTPLQTAHAHVRLGICYDTLGDRDRAREQFRIVVEGYASETAAANLARRYLGDPVAENPARFMPPEMLFYIELVNPGEQVVHLAEFVRGTPLQNPLDYLSSLRQRPRGAEPQTQTQTQPARPGPVERVAAVINKFYLREAQKIGGLAFGIPAGENPEDTFLGVFFPGRSDVLPGIASNLLATAPRAGFAGALQLFRIPQDREEGAPVSDDSELHVAFGDELLLWGKPRRVLEEAVLRYERSGPSLASNADFQSAQSARSGALLFAYVGPTWPDVLSRSSAGADRIAFDALRRILDLDRLRPLTATLSASSRDDLLSVAVHAGFGGGAAEPLWPAFRTPEVTPELLRGVPAEALGFACLRLGGAAERWAALRRAGEDLAAHLEPEKADELLAGLQKLAASLEQSPGGDFLAAMDGLVVGAQPSRPFHPLESLFAVVTFTDAERGEEKLRDALAAVAYAAFATPASRSFFSEPLDPASGSAAAPGTAGALEVHCLEPIPSLKLQYLRLDGRFAVSFSRNALRSIARAWAAPDSGGLGWFPRGASKVVLLHPERILASFDAKPTGTTGSPPPADPDPGRLILRHLRSVLLYTREGDGSISVELQVPQVTESLRAILDAYAAASRANGQNERSGG
jgi:hypothetical protein